MLPIYYINLASRVDRRAFMDAQLSALGLSGTRVEAATPADITDDEASAYCDPLRPRFLRLRELACTKSHERVWQMMIRAGDARALILEDDAELSPALPGFLADLSDSDVDIIRIETTGATLRMFPPAETRANGIELRPFRSTPMGSAGYILTGSAARRLLGHPAFRIRQTDLALYNPFDEPGASMSRLQTVPGLCRQLGDARSAMSEVARSDIAQMGEPHLFARLHPWRYRMIKLREDLPKGWRNAVDHFANKKRGLTRMRIPFADKA